MTDPLEALREPIGPVDPDPAFAGRLRARLERALELPRGVAVSTNTQARAPLKIDHAASRPSPVLPFPTSLSASGRAAIDWYIEVFGAVLRAIRS